METNPNNAIYSAGFAAAVHGDDELSSEYAAFYEKEPDGTIGASNVYVLGSGSADTAEPEVSARFTVKKILYGYFHSYDYADANKVALAMRTANNEIYEYAKIQGSDMSAAAITAAVTEGKLVLGNMGGSHAYIIRNGKIFQITEDAPKNPDGTPAVSPKLGLESDITIDIYDGIDVRGGDILILVSESLDEYIGKTELLEAAAEPAPRRIVQHILDLPSIRNGKVCASAAAIRIYDQDSVNQMIRVDGCKPADMDLNAVKKEVALIRRNHPKKKQQGTANGGQTMRKGSLLLPLLIALLLLTAAGIWAATQTTLLSDIFPPADTATPTPDWAAATIAVYQQTAEIEKQAAVAATVMAIPTQTPYPTYTPVFIDLNEQPAADSGSWEEDSANDPYAPDSAYQGISFSSEDDILPQPTEEPVIIKEAIINEKSGSEMVYIPAGTFLLGSDPAVDAYSYEEEEEPQLRVYLDAYWIDKTEVTNAQYLKCVEAGVCEQNYNMLLYSPGFENYPVTYVSKNQADRYCSWIGGRLPSEYEWEKAARGTDGRLYPWGEEEPSLENDFANIPNYVDEEGNGNDLFPAGSFPNGVSPYGALDMAGNVWEWTGTWYSLNYYSSLAAEEELSGTTVSNPSGPEMGDTYVIRGGSCAATEVNNYPAYTRTANRSYVNMSSGYYIGFRCILPDDAITEAELTEEANEEEAEVTL